MEPKKNATNSGWVRFYLVMHSLNGGGSNSVVGAGFASFQDSPED